MIRSRLMLGVALATVALPALPDEERLYLQFKHESGASIRLDQPGVLYLVDFWSIGCRPCYLEMPALIALEKEYSKEPRFRFVSVAVEAFNPGWIRERLASQQLAPPTIYFDTERWFESLLLKGFPTKLLIRDGQVLAERFGANSRGSVDEWKRLIQEHLPRSTAK
jgi:thiol-disulfide isomerase/thioredoxin